MLRCACTFCSAALELPDHQAGAPFACPNCGRTFTVPFSPGNPQSYTASSVPEDKPANLPLSSLPAARRVDDPKASLLKGAVEVPATDDPRRPKPIRLDPVPPPAPPRRDRPVSRDPHGDEEDEAGDYFQTGRRRAAASPQLAARAAQIGFTCTLIGLFGILAGLYVFFTFQRRGDPNIMETVCLVLSFVALVMFILTLLGVIYSGRGLDASNEQNRGLGVAGLVGGILGLTLSVVGGAITLLCGVFLHMLRF
ncbi:MAG: hypothetical protein U0793_14600 [Gemmataceae bacterium]